jgi:hypothetical protein
LNVREAKQTLRVTCSMDIYISLASNKVSIKLKNIIVVVVFVIAEVT